MVNKNRNNTVDVLRGIAMLLVVLQHTMVGCTIGSEQSIAFKIAWTLQMPLFMLISGYVTRYSKVIHCGHEFGKTFVKRTVAYLLPWAVWSLLIRGVVCGETTFLNIPYMLWHMDSGYWFMFSLWTIVVLFMLAQWGAEVVCKNKPSMAKEAAQLLFYIIGMTLLGAIGLWQGLSFLCIKLSLYYMPFYYCGYLFGKYQEQIVNWKNGKVLTSAVAVAALVWVALLVRFDFYSMPDSGANIILRAAASLFGCAAVCGLMTQAMVNTKVSTGGVQIVGSHSMELYLTHYLFLSMVQLIPQWEANPLMKLIIVSVNFLMTLGISAVVIYLASGNKMLHFILWGKKPTQS